MCIYNMYIYSILYINRALRCNSSFSSSYFLMYPGVCMSFYLTFSYVFFFYFYFIFCSFCIWLCFFPHYQLINMISSLRLFSSVTSFTDEETPPELFRMRSQPRPVGKYHKFRWKFNRRSKSFFELRMCTINRGISYRISSFPLFQNIGHHLFDQFK